MISISPILIRTHRHGRPLGSVRVDNINKVLFRLLGQGFQWLGCGKVQVGCECVLLPISVVLHFSFTFHHDHFPRDSHHPKGIVNSLDTYNVNAWSPFFKSFGLTDQASLRYSICPTVWQCHQSHNEDNRPLPSFQNLADQQQH